MSAAPKFVSALKGNLDQAIDRALAGQRIVGTVVLVSQNGEPIYERAAGLADREAGTAMRDDTVFRLASLTKPLVSATALALVERGQLNLTDAVTKWIPEFQPALPDGSEPEITVRQLLTHTAGLSYGFLEPEEGPYHNANVSDGLDQPGLSMQENLRRIASAPLAYQPRRFPASSPESAAWAYSVAHDVLGEVVARASGSSLPEAVSRFVTAPLSMTDTGFIAADPSRLATPYADGSPSPVRMGDLHLVKMIYGPGSIRFAPARVFDRDSFASGGCGMVGTAGDFRKFLEALRTGGGAIISAESVKSMTTDQTGGQGPAPGTAFGFGLSVITEPTAIGSPQSAGTFAWGGVYGHSWFVDRAKGLTTVMLTNTAIEGMTAFPMQIRDAIYASQ